MNVVELAATISKMRDVEMDAMVDVIEEPALYRLLATLKHEHRKRFEQTRHGDRPRGIYEDDRVQTGHRSDDCPEDSP